MKQWIINFWKTVYVYKYYFQSTLTQPITLQKNLQNSDVEVCFCALWTYLKCHLKVVPALYICTITVFAVIQFILHRSNKHTLDILAPI